MRTKLVMFLVALTTAGYGQNLTTWQNLDRERVEQWKKRSGIADQHAINTPLLQESIESQEQDLKELSGLRRARRTASASQRENSNARGQSASAKLRKSALVKYYNTTSKVYEEKYMYRYKYESDSAYWQYTIEKNEEGQYTDTVSYEYYNYYPGLTTDREAEYKYFEKLNGKFYLLEWSKGLGSYISEGEDGTQTEWFNKLRLSFNYDLDEASGKYYLSSKSENVYDDNGNEVSDLEEEYNVSGAIIEGWKSKYALTKFADGKKQYKREYFEYDKSTSQYKLYGEFQDLYNAKGEPLSAYGLEWNNTLGKLDSVSSSKSYYDTEGRHLKSIDLNTYDATTKLWKNGNRNTSEYQPGVTYRTREWLNNGTWTNSDKEEIVTSPNKKDVIVNVWSGDTWQKSIKWAYEYYDNQKLKMLKLYLWNGSAWYISEYSQYQYYEYNSKGQQTLFERYSRYDRGNTYKVIWEYDAQDRVVKIKQYNAYTNNMNAITWDNAYETSYTYNALGQQIDYEFMRWKNGAWMKNTKYSHVIDKDGNLLETSNAGYHWDTGEQQWGIHIVYTLIEGDFASTCPKPTVTLSGSDTEAILLVSSSASGNQWFKDGEAISDADGVSYSVNEPGIYHVLVTTEMCFSHSEEQTIVITDVEESLDVKVKVYPNPAAHELMIDASSWAGSKDFQVSVYGSSGNLLNTYQGNAVLHLDIRSFNTGNYFLKISKGAQVITKQIIKH